MYSSTVAGLFIGLEQFFPIALAVILHYGIAAENDFDS